MPFLFAYGINRFSHDVAQMSSCGRLDTVFSEQVKIPEVSVLLSTNFAKESLYLNKGLHLGPNNSLHCAMVNSVTS